MTGMTLLGAEPLQHSSQVLCNTTGNAPVVLHVMQDAHELFYHISPPQAFWLACR